MKEIWKKTAFDGYMVSNLGRIKSVDRFLPPDGSHPYGQKRKGKILSSTQNGQLYNAIRLGAGAKKSYIHILVATAFIPNPENKKEVNHINGNKKDNRAENLEWVSRLENVKHAKEVLKKDWCMLRHRVQMITKDKNILFNSIADAERYLFGKRTKSVEKQIRKKGYYSKNNILIY